MTEFETIKTALERMGHELEVTEFNFDFFTDKFIEDKTAEVDFSFDNCGKLIAVDKVITQADQWYY